MVWGYEWPILNKKIMKILQLNRGKSIVNNYCAAVALQPRDNLILKRCGFKHFQRCTFFCKISVHHQTNSLSI